MKYRAILPLVFLASASALTGCGAMKGTAAAEKAVDEFHARLDKLDFKGIYSAADPDLKAASTEKDFVALLDAVHRKLGTVQSADKVGFNIKSFNFKTNIVLHYSTKFAEGAASESFNYRMDGDKAMLLGYNISSPTLILK